MKKLIWWFIGIWILYSVVDFAIARSMCGGMYLTDYNIVVVLYKLLNSMLIGYKF